MNLNDKTMQITESGLIATLMTIFVFLGIYLTPIILFLYPIPFVILGVRHNAKYSILSMVASFILVSILIDPITSIFVVLLFGLLAIVLPYMINKGYDSYKIILYGMIVSFLSILITITVSGYIMGVSFVQSLQGTFDAVLNTQKSFLAEMDLSTYEINDMIEIFKEAFDYTLLIIPSILIIFSLFNTYLNYWLSVAVLKRLKYKTIEIPKFSKFRLPNNIILGLLVIGIGTAIINYFEVFYYDTIELNIVVLTLFMFFIQGLAVIIYLLNKTKLNSIIKGIIIGILVFYSPLMIIIALVGLIDTIVDLRKLKRG